MENIVLDQGNAASTAGSNPDLGKFIAVWQREGYSPERIAALTARHIRLAATADDETWEPLEPAEPRHANDDAVEQPHGGSLDMQTAIAAGMQVMADPGNEPRLTREPLHPRLGRSAIDINAPENRRILERLRPRSLAEIAALKPPQWLIARHIPENSLIALFGRFSTCKSFLAISWALSIASGKPWLGRRTQQGHVVYISAEGTSGINKRAMAFCKENSLKELPAKFHAITSAVDMTSSETLDFLALAIKQTLGDVKPSLIIIDTLNRCFGGGDENSTKDMSAFVRGCDAMREEFGASVLIIHHAGHDAGKGLRGATALPSAMDIAFQLKKPKGSTLAILKNEDPAKPHKDSAPLPDQALEFVEIEIDELKPTEDDPHATTSLVVRAANAEAAAEAERQRAVKRGTSADETLDAIKACENGTTLADLMKSTGKPRSTLRSHRDKLLGDGRIRQEGELLIAVEDEMSPLEEADELLAEQG